MAMIKAAKKEIVPSKPAKRESTSKSRDEAKAAKHADGKNKTAEVLGTDPNQADDVSREDGATEYDPIAHQRAAMQSWSAKPAAKGSA